MHPMPNPIVSGVQPIGLPTEVAAAIVMVKTTRMANLQWLIIATYKDLIMVNGVDGTV